MARGLPDLWATGSSSESLCRVMRREPGILGTVRSLSVPANAFDRRARDAIDSPKPADENAREAGLLISPLTVVRTPWWKPSMTQGVRWDEILQVELQTEGVDIEAEAWRAANRDP